MSDETDDDLRRLNAEIPLRENGGDRLFFEERLAPMFAFRRASGAFDNREMFLLSLTKDGNRACDPKTIELVALGKTRVLVNCVVTTGNDRFHNTRLFVKDKAGCWRVLAWANERL